MKKISMLLMTSMLILTSGFWGCKRPVFVAPDPPNPAPVCAFTPLPNTTNLFFNSNYAVIQSSASWTSANGVGTAVPPVDFSKQMILEYSQPITCNCGCTVIPPVITSVCFYRDHIEVDYQVGGTACPIAPGGLTCGSFFFTNYQALASVPQSNLPVSWVVQNSPAPTPTP
jgi:hypothetical protein